MNNQFAKLHILITRPEHQALTICQQLQAAGAMVSCLPVIEIAAPTHEEQTVCALQQIDTYDNVIFVSRNAVDWAFRLVETFTAHALTKPRIGAIGKQTAAALHGLSVVTDDVPAAGFTSEHFLALASMQQSQVAGRNILIVRGEGGRTLLAQTLQQRGAKVEHAEVYRRICPSLPSAQAVLRYQKVKSLDVIAVTSCEGLHNLLALLQAPDWLFNTSLLVGSQRIATTARQLGFVADVIVAADPGDRAMQEALANWWQEAQVRNNE